MYNLDEVWWCAKGVGVTSVAVGSISASVVILLNELVWERDSPFRVSVDGADWAATRRLSWDLWWR